MKAIHKIAGSVIFLGVAHIAHEVGIYLVAEAVGNHLLHNAGDLVTSFLH